MKTTTLILKVHRMVPSSNMEEYHRLQASLMDITFAQGYPNPNHQPEPEPPTRTRTSTPDTSPNPNPNHQPEPEPPTRIRTTNPNPNHQPEPEPPTRTLQPLTLTRARTRTQTTSITVTLTLTRGGKRFHRGAMVTFGLYVIHGRHPNP
jgi:hypothetical protein